MLIQFIFKEDLLMKLSRCAVLVLLMGLTSVSFASRYNPNQLAQFKSTNQCDTCDLSGAVISGKENHSNAVITNSNLTGAVITGTFAYANFGGSNLSGSDWSSANLSNASFAYIPLIKANFSNAILTYAKFDGAVTTDAVFNNANLYGSNITQQQLDNAASYCWAILPDGTRKNC